MKPAGVIVWLTGRPAAGKSTLAAVAAADLRQRGRTVEWLDSDAVRQTLMPSLGFGARDRDHFYAQLGELALDAAKNHDVVLVSATAPFARYRDSVRSRAGRFIEVFVTAPDAILIARDPKGLYAAARDGTVSQLPGIGAAYEPPLRPEVICETTGASVASEADAIIARVEQSLALTE